MDLPSAKNRPKTEKSVMGLLMGLQNGVTFFMKWGYKSRFLTPFPDIENALNSEDKPQKR